MSTDKGFPPQKRLASDELSSEVMKLAPVGTPIPVTDESEFKLPKPDTLAGSNEKLGTQPQSQSGTTAMPGKLGRYQLIKEIGRGGMGVVYLAEDTVLKRNVALKLPQFESHNQDQMQARFIREAQMAAQLSHVNICQVYDVDVIDGRYVMAMEYIEGKTLATFMKSGKSLSDRQAALLIRKVAQAVELAHQRGLIHRDLKPGNIMLPAPDPVRKVIEPKVMDFGLAKSLAAKGTELTKSGMIVGTPCYMSKEQWSGKDSTLGPSCDVYSLGIIFYELLTGKLPYKVDPEEPPTSWFVQMVTQPQIKPAEHKPGIDPSLEAIVLKAIATEPQYRYATMAEFASELDAWLKGKPLQRQTQLGIDLGFLPTGDTKNSVVQDRSEKKISAFVFSAAGLSIVSLIGIIVCLNSFLRTPATQKNEMSSYANESDSVGAITDSNVNHSAVPKRLRAGEPTNALDETTSNNGRDEAFDVFQRVLPVGQTFVGTWNNIFPGNTNPPTSTSVRICFTKRRGGYFESSCDFSDINRWQFKGTISIDDQRNIILFSKDVDCLTRDHPNEGNTEIRFQLINDGRRLAGVAYYTSGSRSEFTADLIVEASETTTDSVRVSQTGTKWTGTLTNDMDTETSPGSMVVIARNDNEMTIRIEVETGAIWDFDCIFQDADSYEITGVRRVQASKGISNPASLEGLRGSGTINGSRLIHRYRVSTLKDGKDFVFAGEIEE